MKKSKCILTTLTATVFAMSVGALVACGDSSDGETKVGVYEITFDANGGAYANGNTVKLHTADGRILAEPTAPEYTGFVFTGYNVKRDGSGETVTFGANGYKFSGATTVYAQWEAQRQDGVYNITFDANGGTQQRFKNDGRQTCEPYFRNLSVIRRSHFRRLVYS